MKSSSLAFLFVGLSGLGLGMAAEACSSSSSPTNNPVDSGPHSSSASSGTGGASSSGSVATGCGSSTSSSASGDAGTCYHAPHTLYPETTAGVYCPFSQNYPTKDTVCAAGQHCCEPPEKDCELSTCHPNADQCPQTDSVDWRCAGPLDCADQAGTICCGQGKIETQAPQPGCGDGGTTIPSYPYVSGFYGTNCQTSCENFYLGGVDGGPGFQVCSQNSDCNMAGYGCIAVEPKGNTIGYCAECSKLDGGCPMTSSSGSSGSSGTSGASKSSTGGSTTSEHSSSSASSSK